MEALFVPWGAVAPACVNRLLSAEEMVEGKYWPCCSPACRKLALAGVCIWLRFASG